MKTISSIIALVSLLFLTSCASVVSLHPIGRERIALEPEQWDGAWLADENVVKMKVIDRENGLVQMAWIEVVGNELRPKSVTFQVLKGGKWMYANVLEVEGKMAEDAYYWGVVKKEQGRIVFFSPAVPAFVQAAESQRIKAVVEKSQPPTTAEASPVARKSGSVKVTLTDTAEAVVRLVEDGGNDYLDLEHPVVFIRLFAK
jgi:hypothetical protein